MNYNCNINMTSIIETDLNILKMYQYLKNNHNVNLNRQTDRHHQMQNHITTCEVTTES